VPSELSAGWGHRRDTDGGISRTLDAAIALSECSFQCAQFVGPRVGPRGGGASWWAPLLVAFPSIGAAKKFRKFCWRPSSSDQGRQPTGVATAGVFQRLRERTASRSPVLRKRQLQNKLSCCWRVCSSRGNLDYDVDSPAVSIWPAGDIKPSIRDVRLWPIADFMLGIERSSSLQLCRLNFLNATRGRAHLARKLKI
jgi:hypothetical protein